MVGVWSKNQLFRSLHAAGKTKRQQTIDVDDDRIPGAAAVEADHLEDV